MSHEILKQLEKLKDVYGYLGAGVFTAEGVMLAGVTEVAGINFEIAGSLFHDGFLMINNNSREAGFGYVDMIQVDTEMGIVFSKCFRDDNHHFHVILVVKKDANIAMTKLMLNRVILLIKNELP